MSRQARGSRWDAVRAAVTGALWPLPAFAVAVAIGLGIALPELDQALAFGEDPIRFVFTGGPSAARTILSAIASSLISVTTLLFSLTIVTLQLASSQYSPRLLQTFVRDRVVQTCLGILLGTFVYALVVLRSVRSADEAQGTSFVPRISVTVAFVLTLAAVGALVAFLSHQTRQLRVETMMRDVHVEAGATLRRLLHQLEEDEQADSPLPPVPSRARPVCAQHSGFLVQVAEGPLLDVLTEARTTLRLVVRPGEPVIEGTPIGWAWCDDPAGEPQVDRLADSIRQHVTVGYERADLGDPSYGLRKLVDIAARALSPGINDPTTAVHALSHVSDLLGVATRRVHWTRRVADDTGVERLLVTSWDFATLLDLALTQPRYYGREDPAVVDRLFGVLAEVAWRVDDDRQRAALTRQLELLRAQVGSAPPVGWTGEDVRRRVTAVEGALAGRWPLP